MLARAEPGRTVVSRFVEAINRQDADAVADCLAFNCVIANFQGVSEHVGAAAVTRALTERFGLKPKMMVAVHNRTTIGDVVAQLEVHSAGVQTLDRRLALYSLTSLGKIARIDIVRG